MHMYYVLCTTYASCPCYSSLCFSIRREVFFPVIVSSILAEQGESKKESF